MHTLTSLYLHRAAPCVLTLIFFYEGLIFSNHFLHIFSLILPTTNLFTGMGGTACLRLRDGGSLTGSHIAEERKPVPVPLNYTTSPADGGQGLGDTL